MKVTDLTLSRFYKDQVSLNEYSLDQINRHNLKKGKKRSPLYYEEITTDILDVFKDQKFSMICLGTRNNWERDCFRRHTSNDQIFSLDISPTSHADFVGDFNKLDLEPKVDVLFSNAIDHSIDPNKTYLNWLCQLKKNGILIVDFSLHEEVGDENQADCSTFSEESIGNFLKHLVENKHIKENVVKKHTHGYLRTMVTK